MFRVLDMTSMEILLEGFKYLGRRIKRHCCSVLLSSTCCRRRRVLGIGARIWIGRHRPDRDVHLIGHQNIDQCILHEWSEHEDCTRRHENVDGFDVRDWWQWFLWLSMLSRQGQQRGHAQSDSSRHRFWLLKALINGLSNWLLYWPWSRTRSTTLSL